MGYNVDPGRQLACLLRAWLSAGLVRALNATYRRLDYWNKACSASSSQKLEALLSHRPRLGGNPLLRTRVAKPGWLVVVDDKITKQRRQSRKEDGNRYGRGRNAAIRRRPTCSMQGARMVLLYHGGFARTCTSNTNSMRWGSRCVVTLYARRLER